MIGIFRRPSIHLRLEHSHLIALTHSFQRIFLWTNDPIVAIWISLALVRHTLISIFIFICILLWFLSATLWLLTTVFKVNFAFWYLVLCVANFIVLLIFVSVCLLVGYFVAFSEIGFVLILGILLIYKLLCSIMYFCSIVQWFLLQIILCISIPTFNLNALANFSLVQSIWKLLFFLMVRGFTIFNFIRLRDLCNLWRIWRLENILVTFWFCSLIDCFLTFG